MVHTHPYRRGEKLTECPKQELNLPNLPPGFSDYQNYNGDSSIDDDQTIRDVRTRYPELLGLLLDNEGYVPYTGTDTDTPDQRRIPRCGY